MILFEKKYFLLFPKRKNILIFFITMKKNSFNPFRPATRRQQAKSFFSIYSLLLSYRDQFFTAEFFQNPVPPYGKRIAVWQHPAGKG